MSWGEAIERINVGGMLIERFTYVCVTLLQPSAKKGQIRDGSDLVGR